MKNEKEFKELIFDALIDLNEEHKENPKNVLNWLIDRQGNFYFYYDANSIFFWDEKNETDFIKLTDSQEAFWDDCDIPKSSNDIMDDIQYYLMLIWEHISYDFPSRPFKLIKTKSGKKIKQPCPTFTMASEFIKTSKTPTIYNTIKKDEAK